METKPTPKSNFQFMKKFDAAPSGILNDTDKIIAQARMEQILAMPPGEPVAVSRPAVVKRSSAPVWRWVAIPAAVAVGVVTSILWPNNPVTPVQSAAAQGIMSNWVPVPTQLNSELTGLADGPCRAMLSDSAIELRLGLIEGNPTGADNLSFQIGELIGAEQRGDFGFLAYASGDGGESGGLSSCFVWFPPEQPGRALVQMTDFRTSSSDGHAVGGRGNFGSMARPRPGASEGDLVLPLSWSGPLELQFPDQSVIDATQFGLAFNDGSAMNAIVGQVGTGADIALATADGAAITPSVYGDWFVAWWPVLVDQAAARADQECWLEFSFAQLDDPLASSNCGDSVAFTPKLQSVTRGDDGALVIQFDKTASRNTKFKFRSDTA